MNTLVSIIGIIIFLLKIVGWIIIAQAVLSWLMAFNVLNFNSPAVRSFAGALDRFTAPLYRPVRKVLPDFGGLDFSPLVILLLLMVLQRILDGVGKDLIASAV